MYPSGAHLYNTPYDFTCNHQVFHRGEKENRSESEAMVIVEGLLGKLARRCYAVLCLGVLVVSVTVAHFIKLRNYGSAGGTYST